MESLNRRLVLGAAGVAGIAALSRFAKAGPLDPPAGPVSPTGHTTDELYDRIARTTAGIAEPRIPVLSLAAAPPYTIGQRGSYYLTSDIRIANGETAIVINTANVTLDLCGYAVSAPNGTSSARGVDVTGNFGDIVLRGGAFSNTRLMLAGQGSVEDCTISGAAGNAQALLLSSSAWLFSRCLLSGVLANSATILVGAGCGLIAETCAFRAAFLGIDVNNAGRAIVRNSEFDGAGFAGIRFLAGTTGAVMDSIFTNCATGCLNQSGAPVKFLRNVAYANTQNYSGIPNLSTDPATAPPWANLSL